MEQSSDVAIRAHVNWLGLAVAGRRYSGQQLSTGLFSSSGEKL